VITLHNSSNLSKLKAVRSLSPNTARMLIVAYCLGLSVSSYGFTMKLKGDVHLILKRSLLEGEILVSFS
jgi:hypothetical protein